MRHSTTAGTLFETSPTCSICGRSECPGVDEVTRCNSRTGVGPAMTPIQTPAKPVEDVPELPQKMNERRMSRTDDHSTSVEAAGMLIDGLRDLQVRVYRLIERDGPLTDDEIEDRGGDPIFAECKFAPTTLRKRRSELLNDGFVEECGKKENRRGRNMKLWRVIPLDCVERKTAPADREGTTVQ